MGTVKVSSKIAREGKLLLNEKIFKKGIDKSKTLCYNQQRRRENAINDVGA